MLMSVLMGAGENMQRKQEGKSCSGSRVYSRLETECLENGFASDSGCEMALIFAPYEKRGMGPIAREIHVLLENGNRP
jgi:hypothetical protein